MVEEGERPAVLDAPWPSSSMTDRCWSQMVNWSTIQCLRLLLDSSASSAHDLPPARHCVFRFYRRRTKDEDNRSSDA